MGYGLECLPDDQTETKLFVGHLPLNTTKFQLRHILMKYASAVMDIYIPPQGNGRKYNNVCKIWSIKELEASQWLLKSSNIKTDLWTKN